MKFIIFTYLSQIPHDKENVANEDDKISEKIMNEVKKISSPGEILTLSYRYKFN
jgi:hypothetical protein